jgi:soluble lytic murein transglycosylase
MEASATAPKSSRTGSRWFRVARLVVLTGAVILAEQFVVQRGEAQAQTAGSRDEFEQKIRACIVARNPNAALRDFAGFAQVLREVASSANIDFRIILAVIDKESGFKADAVGTSGEIGLMQLLPSTAKLVVKKLGLDWTPPVIGKNGAYTSLGSLADPKFNVRVGATYLRWQIERYGVNPTALRAYNRNPDKAREHRPLDRYAEEVSLRYLVIAQAIR